MIRTAIIIVFAFSLLITGVNFALDSVNNQFDQAVNGERREWEQKMLKDYEIKETELKFIRVLIERRTPKIGLYNVGSKIYKSYILDFEANGEKVSIVLPENSLKITSVNNISGQPYPLVVRYKFVNADIEEKDRDWTILAGYKIVEVLIPEGYEIEQIESNI